MLRARLNFLAALSVASASACTQSEATRVPAQSTSLDGSHKACSLRDSVASIADPDALDCGSVVPTSSAALFLPANSLRARKLYVQLQTVRRCVALAEEADIPWTATTFDIDPVQAISWVRTRGRTVTVIRPGSDFSRFCSIGACGSYVTAAECEPGQFDAATVQCSREREGIVLCAAGE